MATPSASNSMMREKIAINDENFFITNGGNTDNHVKFSLATLSGDRTITIPDSDVDLGAIGTATSLSASDLTVGDDNVIIDTTSTSYINVGSNDSTSGINIGTSDDRSISVGNSTGATSVTIDSGSGGISLDSTGVSNFTVTPTSDGGDLTISLGGNTDSSLVLSSSGTGSDALQVTASAGGMDITSDGVMDITSGGAMNVITSVGSSASISILPDDEGTLTLGAATNTVSLNGNTINIASDGILDLSSQSVSSEAINLNSDTGGITIQSATSSGAYGTNVEGLRFFKIDDDSIDNPQAINYTFSPSTSTVYYIDARVAITDKTTLSSSGCIVVKGAFTNEVVTDGPNVVSKIGDSTESFGALPTDVSFTLEHNDNSASSLNDTFSVRIMPDSGSYQFSGTIMLTTEDTGLTIA